MAPPAVAMEARRFHRAPLGHRPDRPGRGPLSLGGLPRVGGLQYEVADEEAGAGSALGEVFGGLADLPVAVLEGGFEGGVDLGAVEGGEGDDGSAADRGLVLRAGEDRGEPGRVAQGAEGGDGGLADEGVGGVGGQRGQAGHRTGLGRLAFAGGPGGHLDHRVVGVVEEADDGHRLGRALATERGHQFQASAADPGIGIGERTGEVRRLEGVEALQRTKGGAPDAGVGVVEKGPRQVAIALVTGDGRLPTATLCVE